MAHTNKSSVPIHERAFDKKYFVNLLGNTKVDTFNQAIYDEPKLAAIAQRLTPDQLRYLIDKIEAKL